MQDSMQIFMKIDSLRVHMGPEDEDPDKTLAKDDHEAVGYQVPAKPLRFELWGAHKDLLPTDPRPKTSPRI